MDWFWLLWEEIGEWVPLILFFANTGLIVGSIIWVLMTKADATSAVAWCLIIFFVPFLGPLLYVFFGYQHVHRPLKRKRRHSHHYRQSAPAALKEKRAGRDGSAFAPSSDSLVGSMARLADRVGASPVTLGNQVDFYHESSVAFEAMLAAIASARHHVHMEFFIILADDMGQRFLDALVAKAKEGVEVRLLYDAMGSHRLPRRLVKPLEDAGGKVSVFLPLNPLRRRMQINMRNHRKILVIDGSIGFVGGLNVGDEYVGKNPFYGYWRDTHLRLQGPCMTHVQAVFCEDWDFAAEENLMDLPEALAGCCYFQPALVPEGPHAVQVIDSGPDKDLKSIREIYFAAILKAQRRVWIASPYFVPDAGLLDALRLAAYMGKDVRFLGQFRADQWIPQYAAQYYWASMLEAGVKIYQYARGMMHSKVVIVDDDWASVGSANLDNRSLHLNFELNCLIYSTQAVDDLAAAFEIDLQHSILLNKDVFARRPFSMRLLENASRLLSPVL